MCCVFCIMSHVHRKCSKCGATQASNPELRMHRFPALNKNNENYYQLISWAMFCYPEKDWFDAKALSGLQKSSKVICSKHFADSAYTSSAKIRLSKFSLPCMDENEENIHAPIAGPSGVSNLSVLGVHGQIMPEQPEVLTSSLTLSVNEQNIQFQNKKGIPEKTPNILLASTVIEQNIKFQKKQDIPEKTPNIPSASTKNLSAKTSKPQHQLSTTENKMYNKCKYLLKKISKLQSALSKKKSIDIVQMLHGNEDVTSLLKFKISPTMALLLQGELQNGKRKQKGRRWTDDHKFLALEIYKKSPRTYKLLSRLFCLPSSSTLRKLLGQFSLKPGINELIFENITKAAKKNSDSDNLCFLTFDEVSIMKNISYNPKSDEIQGYQDHGHQGKSKVFASHALVFMLVWIRKKQKQPVAFYLSGDYVTADRLTVLIKEVLHECLKAGINVCATVCDMDGVNVRALENLGSTVEKPYFEFEGKEIVSLPDPPHLLKCLRNLFMTYDVKLPIPVQSSTTANTTGTGIASWKHIEQFFELDNVNPHFVFAPKLTKRHLQPNGKEKMRVKLATQIFSHSVAMGIYSKASTNELPAGAVATATFLEHFNNLFDLLNSNAADKEDGKPFKTNWTEKSPHKDFIMKSKKIITEMEFIGCKRKPPSQLGWLKLLNGYERLWDNLNNKHKIKTIATRRINQDPLENCFGAIRANCGANDNPTAAQFVAGLKTSIITNQRNYSGSYRNCEDDNSELLENFKYLFSKKNTVINGQMPNPCPDLSDISVCAYVCGFIFKKYAKNCDNCKKAMLAENPTEVHKFTEFKEYVDGKHSLKYASNSFIACVEKSAELVNKYLKENPHSDHIKRKCLDLIRGGVNFNFLNACKEHNIENVKMIENSVVTILLKRFCVLENRKFSNEVAQRRLAKKIKILKNS